MFEQFQELTLYNSEELKVIDTVGPPVSEEGAATPRAFIAGFTPTIRTLFFNSSPDVIQSALGFHSPSRPMHERLLLDPHRALALAPAMLGAAVEQSRIAVIGGGGGSLPATLHHCLPKSAIVSVECDPEVAEVAQRFFPASMRMRPPS
ncbi:hypothetical protein CYMTET_26022 [Cymbomonas tetramitiformis]|uniref:Spermidine synthase n=1 Tax=Cymbomonas tetramitiformis TaxID=36881 RepID=A0AAE0FSL4_9CHLO|nr:hypothetical protein CYMTET_26022 [Cymbomonas tetramitiformis]